MHTSPSGKKDKFRPRTGHEDPEEGVEVNE